MNTLRKSLVIAIASLGLGTIAVAAPLSTVDLNCPTGDDIPIEERDIREITHVRDIQLAPEGISVSNYAFDVTPARLVSGLVTERGVAPASGEGLLKLFPERRKSA